MDNEIRNDVEMEENIEEVEFLDLDEEVEEKKSVFKSIVDGVKKVPEKGKQIGKWVLNNPEAATTIAGGVGMTILVGLGICDAKKAKRTVYSKDIGETVELKRELNNDDKVELDYRCSTGQTKIEALNNMGLVKHKK